MDMQDASAAQKISRNAPCPCGSGKKYKKCCWGTDKDPASIVNCAICEKDFNHNLPGAFKSIKRAGKRIYFCPECNLDLACSVCQRKLGTMSFGLFTCAACGAVKIVCDICTENGLEPECLGH
jgi:hypothetical protein